MFLLCLKKKKKKCLAWDSIPGTSLQYIISGAVTYFVTEDFILEGLSLKDKYTFYSVTYVLQFTGSLIRAMPWVHRGPSGPSSLVLILPLVCDIDLPLATPLVAFI